MVFEACGHMDQAIDHYSRAHLADPTNPQYIGNLAKALLIRDNTDPAAQEVLTELLQYESRPEWSTWAREQLATGKFRQPDDSGHTYPSEVLPPPTREELPPGEFVLPVEPELPMPENVYP